MKKSILMSLCLLSAFSMQTQAKSYALLVGMDFYNRNAYQTRYDDGATAGVKNDINNIRSILNASSYEVTELRNKQATHSAIINAAVSIGKKIEKGDQFLFYFSGHGDLLPDSSGDEKSKFDQALVAYDKFLVDDEVYLLLKQYFTNTQNIMMIDACHSGTSYKIMTAFFLDFRRFKGKNKAFNNEIKAEKQEQNFLSCKFGERLEEPFDLIYFGATPDGKLAGGTTSGGVLTTYLGMIFKEARKNKNWHLYNYRRLACELRSKMASKQILQYHEIGNAAKNYSSQTFLKSY